MEYPYLAWRQSTVQALSPTGAADLDGVAPLFADPDAQPERCYCR